MIDSTLIKSIKNVLTIFFTLIVSFGCGSNSSIVHTGSFIDSYVEGMQYKSLTQTGLTDSMGQFTYMDDEYIDFYIGDVFIGNAYGKEIITPVDLVDFAHNETHPTVTNICRFLQSLDEDLNPDNGIYISNDTRHALENKSVDFSLSINEFETDPDVLDVFETVNVLNIFEDSHRELVATTVAQNHMGETLSQWGLDSDLEIYDDALWTYGSPYNDNENRFITISHYQQTPVILSGTIEIVAH